MPVMSDADKAFIADTVAKTQAKSMNQGFTLNISGPAGDWSQAFGNGNRRPQVPMGINDRGRIGSTSKSFISRLILREIDRGTPIPGVVPAAPVTLDTTLNHFVSGVPRSDQITIKNMLMMRSGVNDYQKDTAFITKFAFNHVASVNEPTDQLNIIRKKTSGSAIDSVFEYTNSNYVLLGEVLRMLTGRTWRDLIKNDILIPCGLTETKVPDNGDWMLPDPWMHGFGVHTWGAIFGKDEDQSAWNPGMFGAAGGLISTAGDLNKWGKIMASGWELSPAMRNLQDTFFDMYPWEYAPYEFGYGLGQFKLKEWVGHDGSVPGYSANCMYHPPTGAVIAGLENYQSANVAIFTDVFVPIAERLYPGSMLT